jgi:iron complex transport system permease protein
MTKGRTTWMVLLVIAALAACALRLYVGETNKWPQGNLLDALNYALLGNVGDRATLMDLRVVRIVIAIIVGVALSISGVALQALLRNPLAEPFILGLSSGAAVGVMAQEIIEMRMQQHLGPIHLGALAGALLSMAVVYMAGRKRGVIDPLGLLLVGVVLSTINGALVMLMRAFYEPAGRRNNVAQWMMGFLNETVGSSHIVTIALLTAAGLAVLLWLAPAMDAAGFSDAEATSVGVNLQRLRVLLFFIASLLAAGAVVLAGPLAFVGLICPHLARLMFGPGHRTLLIGSALIGAILIVLADVGAVTLDFGRSMLPLGIFTALIGGPAFLWMLRPHLGRSMD